MWFETNENRRTQHEMELKMQSERVSNIIDNDSSNLTWNSLDGMPKWNTISAFNPVHAEYHVL